MDSKKLEELKQKYTATSEQIEEISALMFKRLTLGKKPAKNPVAIMVGGQPGAGKSGLIDKTLAELPNAVVLDVDDFRYFHPNIKEILKKYPNDLATFTISFVNTVFDNVCAKIEKEKYNIIAQKTLKDDAIIYDTLNHLSDAGYAIVIRVLAVSELESKMSALERSLAVKNTVGYCRWTPINNQNYAYNGIPATCEAIYASNYCDAMQVYKRNDGIPTHSFRVYSIMKDSSKDKLEKVKKDNPELMLENFGHENYQNTVDAILKTRDKNTLKDIQLFMTRIILAKRVMDEEGLQYLNQLEQLVTDYYLKLNDMCDKMYMDNNIKLELAKEVMARKIAFACKNGFDESNSELQLLLDEEKEMNKFNPVVIEKIINVYGKEIKEGVK